MLEYTHVDLVKNQVTAIISYENEVKMTVIVDVGLNQIYKEGNIGEILSVLPSRDEDSYLEEIKGWSEIFIDKKVTNPKKYFEQFI